jgi:hypothetical protein
MNYSSLSSLTFWIFGHLGIVTSPIISSHVATWGSRRSARYIQIVNWDINKYHAPYWGVWGTCVLVGKYHVLVGKYHVQNAKSEATSIEKNTRHDCCTAKNLKLVGFPLFPVDEIPIEMASLLGFSRSFSGHRCLNHFDGHWHMGPQSDSTAPDTWCCRMAMGQKWVLWILILQKRQKMIQ